MANNLHKSIDPLILEFLNTKSNDKTYPDFQESYNDGYLSIDKLSSNPNLLWDKKPNYETGVGIFLTIMYFGLLCFVIVLKAVWYANNKTLDFSIVLECIGLFGGIHIVFWQLLKNIYSFYYSSVIKSEVIYKGYLISGKYGIGEKNKNYLSNFYSKKH